MAYALRTLYGVEKGRNQPQCGRRSVVMARQTLVSEFWEFLKTRKRYWLLPIVIVLLLMGALIVFTESSAVAPFIYALF